MKQRKFKQTLYQTNLLASVEISKQKKMRARFSTSRYQTRYPFSSRAVIV